MALLAFGPHHLSPIARSIWGILIFGDGSARPCCNTHRRKEIRGPQLPDTLEIALCCSRSALWKAGDFCTAFLILQGEKKNRLPLGFVTQFIYSDFLICSFPCQECSGTSPDGHGGTPRATPLQCDIFLLRELCILRSLSPKGSPSHPVSNSAHSL